MVVAIFSLVGFECATAFGEEAKKPLVTIPLLAVIASLLLTAAFFVFITYVETHALANNNPLLLDQLDAPLSTLSEKPGRQMDGRGDFVWRDVQLLRAGHAAETPERRIAGGFHSCGPLRRFPISFGSSHKNNLTPHVAITCFAVVQF